MLRQYSPKENVLSWGGIIPVMYADGSMIKVEDAEDMVSLSVGAAGDVVMVGNFNPTGMITFRLQNESPTNDLLSVRATSQKLALKLGRPMVPYPVFVRSLNRTLPYAKGAFSVLQKIPEGDLADEAGVREWVILVADLDTWAPGALV